MQCYSVHTGIGERRLLRYKTNTGRMIDQTREYVKDKDGVDTVLGVFGAAGNITTSFLENAGKDMARWAEERKEPILPYEGNMARTRESLRELFGIFKHPASGVISILKLPGDVGMDIYDFIIQNDHRPHIRARIASVLQNRAPDYASAA